MKRDMELVRNILLFLESDSREYYDEPDGGYMLIGIDGYSKEEIDYHLGIMKDGGVIKGDLPRAGDGVITHGGAALNWHGHDFIDAFRSDNKWGGMKKFAKEKGIEVSNIPFDVLIEVGKSYVRSFFN